MSRQGEIAVKNGSGCNGGGNGNGILKEVKEGWVTIVENDNDGKNVLRLVESILVTQTTRRDMIVIVTKEISTNTRMELKNVFDLVVELQLTNHQGNLKSKLSTSSWLMLYIWSLTDYEKLVFVHPNSFVVSNCDELFDIEADFAGVPSTSIQIENKVGAFVFVCKPNIKTFKNMISHFESTNGINILPEEALNSCLGNGLQLKQGKLGPEFCSIVNKDLQKRLCSNTKILVFGSADGCSGPENEQLAEFLDSYEHSISSASKNNGKLRENEKNGHEDKQSSNNGYETSIAIVGMSFYPMEKKEFKQQPENFIKILSELCGDGLNSAKVERNTSEFIDGTGLFFGTSTKDEQVNQHVNVDAYSCISNFLGLHHGSNIDPFIMPFSASFAKQLEIAVENLSNGKLDLGIVCGLINSNNSNELLGTALILKRMPDAFRDNQSVLGILNKLNDTSFETDSSELELSEFIELLAQTNVTNQTKINIGLHNENFYVQNSNLEECLLLNQINDWNNTNKVYPSKCIHELFQEQVENNPNSIAIIHGDSSLTYSELNIQTNKLARYLIHLGVNKESLVCICVPHSIDMMIGLLGILKAGGAYVPIDPSYPKERISYMLTNSETQIVITQRDLAIKLEDQLKDKQVLCIDELQQSNSLNEWPGDNLQLDYSLNSLVYVMYTSGSTGKPKGVMLEHSNLTNYLCYCAENYLSTGNENTEGQNGPQIIPLYSSLSFDLTVTSLFTPLVIGHSIFIPGSIGNYFDQIVSDLNDGGPYGFMKLTPAHLELFKSILQPEGVSSLTNTFIIGGENVTIELVSPLFTTTNNPKLRIINEYGPTETTVGCTTFFLDQTSLVSPICQELSSVPIGKPIANTQIYILDKNKCLVPIGEIGEIHVGGAGVGRGYWKRPELTAEKFITNPYGLNETDRLYKTGDLGKYLPDGNLLFLGRIDDQVKIRGFRIELDEIEAVLVSYPFISQSTIGIHDNEGNKSLIAFIILKEGEAVSNLFNIKDLKQYLSERLSDYMIPTRFILVDQFPLTPSGKIDKKAMLNEVDSKIEIIPPINQIEAQMIEIWSELLNISQNRIGITQDFYELGGNSIKSIQLIAKFKQELNLVNINVGHVAKYRNIQDIYENVIHEELQHQALMNSLDNANNSNNRPISMLPLQKIILSQSQHEGSKNNAKSSHSYYIKIPTVLKNDKLKAALEKLVESHQIFKLQFNCDSIIHLDDCKVILKELDVKCLNNVEEASSIQFETELDELRQNHLQNFNFTNSQVVEYLHGFKDGSSRLYFRFNHALILDTTSWKIIIEDLHRFYNQEEILNNENKASSYTQWLVFMNEYANIYKQEKYYWNNLLSDYNNDSQVNQFKEISSIWNHVALQLSKAESKALFGPLTNNTYKTKPMELVLTSLGYILNQNSNNSRKINHIMFQDAVNRNNVGGKLNCDEIVGDLTSLYPIRLEINSAKELGFNLKRVKEIIRGVPNHGLGFSSIIGLDSVKSLPKITFRYLGEFNSNQGNNNDWNLILNENNVMNLELIDDDSVLIFNCYIMNGNFKCQLHSKLNQNLSNQLIEFFKLKLVEIISYCSVEEEKEEGQTQLEFTMSDFIDFEPFIIYDKNNSSAADENSKRIFMFPPALGGADSYLHNVIPKCNKYNQFILFNNFYKYLSTQYNEDYTAVASFENLAIEYINCLKRVQVQGPYHLFGWSFGGTLAFEVARQLLADGEEVGSIIMIDPYFNYKTSALTSDIDLNNIQSQINKSYSPTLACEIPTSTNIILFKASKPVLGLKSMQGEEYLLAHYNNFNSWGLFEYYAKYAIFNHLDDIIHPDSFKTIIMPYDHFNWINSKAQIEDICNAF